MKTVSVVIPVYFNETSLPLLFDELREFEAQLAQRQLNLELIFVNDGSKDNSQQVLIEFKQKRPQTKIVKHTKNFGAIAASKTGFQYVTGDAFLVHSADLQDPVSQILAMVDEWLKGHKYVIAVRTDREDPMTTKIFSRIYYWILQTLVLADYPTGGFDLMLSEKEILPYLLKSDRHVNVNVYTYALGYTPKTLFYARRKRTHGRSRWTFRKKLNHMVNTITSFSAAPIRIMAVFGFFVSLVSFLYGAHMIISRLQDKVSLPGFVTIVVMISFFSGLILLMLGIIGEYMYRTFERTGHRPEAVVESAYL